MGGSNSSELYSILYIKHTYKIMSMQTFKILVNRVDSLCKRSFLSNYNLYCKIANEANECILESCYKYNVKHLYRFYSKDCSLIFSYLIEFVGFGINFLSSFVKIIITIKAGVILYNPWYFILDGSSLIGVHLRN